MRPDPLDTSERAVVFIPPPLRSLMLNFSWGERGLNVSDSGDYWVKLSETPTVCAALENSEYATVLLTYGFFGAVIREGEKFDPEVVMRPVGALKQALHTAGGNVIYTSSGRIMGRTSTVLQYDLESNPDAAAQPAPVLLVNAINNGMLFDREDKVDLSALASLLRTRGFSRGALARAVQAAAVAAGLGSMRDLLEQHQLVTKGLDAFAAVLNEHLKSNDHETRSSIRSRKSGGVSAA